MKSFFFLSLSFLGYVVPVHWTSPPPKTPDCTLFPPLIFSCQNLAEIALFESEYDSSTGPNTKLDAFALCIILCMTQHWLLSLSIPRLDSVRTWSVLLVFLVPLCYNGYSNVQFCLFLPFTCEHICVIHQFVDHLGLFYSQRLIVLQMYLVMAAFEGTWNTEMATIFFRGLISCPLSFMYYLSWISESH